MTRAGLGLLVVLGVAWAQGAVPPLDTSKHLVPLEEIYFDTFNPLTGAVPLSEASPELIRRLRDAIPPLNHPRYEPADAAEAWLRPDDLVLGYAAGGGAWAYPVRILNFHEIVNDTLAGEPVLISYCPLCFSGIVYSRRLEGRVLRFGNTSALYESDLVMLDYETGSYWWQVAGRAIVGPLTGARLEPLPSMMTTWADWRALHPDTLVLSRDTGFNRPYDRDPFANYADFVNNGRFPFPVSDASRDPRLLPATVVLAVKVGDAARAYPIEALGRRAIQEVLDGQEIVVFIDAEARSGGAYRPVVAGRRLRFVLEDGRFRDRETQSTWDLAGRAVSGPLKGQRLEPLPTRTAFWFAVVAAEPRITVYAPDANELP